MSVTNPGNQSDVSGTAITALQIAATDSSSTATLSYADNGTLPTGLSIDPSTGAITGTPTTAGTYPVTITATDNAGYFGSASFTWTITNVVSVTNPGNQSDVSGTAITALDQLGHRLLVDGHHLELVGHRPADRALHRPVQRDHHRHPDHGRQLLGHGDGHRQRRLHRLGQLHLGHHQRGRASPTRATRQTSRARAITTLAIAASDTSSTATLSYTDSGTLPTGLSIDPTSGAITGTPTTAGSYAVTITATDDAGFSGPASFTWDITNVVTVTNPGDQSDLSGAAITALTNSATDSSSTATIASWSATGLPTGLTINATSGTVTGTPTTAGSYPVTITATDRPATTARPASPGTSPTP